ncbi:hypothetical protein Tco_1270078 [Tanacetum coccineum]
MATILGKLNGSKSCKEVVPGAKDTILGGVGSVNADEGDFIKYFVQFWATTKAKMVNGERQLQALVDKKKVTITETSIRNDLHLEDAGGIDCLPTATIFEELARMGSLHFIKLSFLHNGNF